MLATFFTWPTKCGLMSQSGPSFHATCCDADRMTDEQVLHLAAAVDEHRLRILPAGRALPWARVSRGRYHARTFAARNSHDAPMLQVLHGGLRLARGRTADALRCYEFKPPWTDRRCKIEPQTLQSPMQPDRTALLTRLLRERILVMDGAMGTMIQQCKLSEKPTFAALVPRSLARPEGRQRPPVAHAARSRAQDPRRVPRGRRGHHRDQHVQRDVDRAGRLRHARRGVRDQPRGRAGSRASAPTRGRRARPTSRASSPAPSGRPTARRRSRPTSTTRARAT